MLKYFFGVVLIVFSMFSSFKHSEAIGSINAYNFSFITIDGDPLPLEKFSGKVILLVNTASQCGFTKQYHELQKLWSMYRERGLVVIGVPSNDFGRQEPEGEGKIKEFCSVNFDIDFPMTTKTIVSGTDAHPFYQWAGKKLGFLAKPRWNFHKYLVDSEGQLIDWFSSPTSPTSVKVLKVINAQLPAKELSN